MRFLFGFDAENYFFCSVNETGCNFIQLNVKRTLR